MTKPLDSAEQILAWQSIWDTVSEKMREEPARPLKPEAPETFESEMLAEHRRAKNETLHWIDTYRLAQDVDRIFGKFNENKEEFGKTAEAMAKSPNPIHPTSVGADQDLRVTPNFSDGPILRQLSDLKIKIESLERDVHNSFVKKSESEENKLQKEVDSIRNKIIELSNQLARSPFDDVS